MTSSDSVLWERWEEVDCLLEQVLDRPEGHRRAFLLEQVGDDRILHEVVTRLLEQLASDPARLDGPPDALLRMAFSSDEARREAQELQPGTRVGRFAITGYRGRGGMATVYEAHRADGAFDQRVAIKVLRRGLDTDDLIARFRTERQILSSVTHANVARLLDGGALEDGRPYLVMELVDGTPITTHADRQRLTIRERLSLFIEVANAVHAAHRQLVVHRDIKPSNILVATDGAVKLLDFGIAKLLNRDDGMTSTGVRLLTPDYASPEQLRGDSITTSGDIYQLGLLLRELLTGVPPLAGDTSPDAPLVHPSRVSTLAFQNVPAPEARAEARRTTPATLSGVLRGDLDIIAGKALRRDPEQRYASVEELSEDVRRYLAGRPILAHPESTRYLVRKFLARNRWAMPTAFVSVLAVVSFIAVLLVQNARLERERDAAQLASERAQETEEFLVDILRSPDPVSGGDGSSLTVVEALQRGRERLDRELADQPILRASLLAAIGRTLAGLGRADAADTVLRQSLALFDEQLGPMDSSSLETRYRIGSNYRAARESRQADSVLQELLQMRQAAGLLGDSTHSALLGQLSAVQLQLEQTDSALALASESVNILRRISDTTSGYYAGALSHLAPALRSASQFDSAETVYGTLLKLRGAEASPNWANLSILYNNIAFLQKSRGNLAAAEQSYRDALRLANDVYDVGHPMRIQYSNNLAATLEVMERYDDVESLRRSVAEDAERHWPDGDWRVGAQHLALARFYVRRARPSDAVEPMRRGWQQYSASLGVAHAWTLVAEAQLGLALTQAGRVDEGARHLNSAREAIRRLPAPPNAELREIIQQLVTALAGSGASYQASQYRALLVTP